MFITEFAEPQLLVIYPGRFQPFHKGHHAVYEWLTGKFGRNNVFIATSNKTDNAKSPFTFAEKSYFMQLTGVPADRIVQATQPYQIESILGTGQVTVANPENTVVIFAVSEKDMAEDPRFSFRPKKDGSDPYFQPLKDIKQTKSMKEHGYIMTVPTFQFNVAGDPMQSASELRAEYAVADPKKRQLIIKDLFGRYTHEAEQIMNSKISRTASIAEAELPAAQLNKLYQYKNQMAQAQQAQATQPEPTPAVSAPDPVTQGDLATLQQRRQKLDTILKLKKELETLIPRAERTWGGMDRGIRADVELDYPTPTTDKEYDELIALYTRQVQQLKNYIQRKRSLYKESVSECGGTGVIASKKQARDPRYSTSLTKDVRPGQIHKNLKAFQLAEEDIAWAKNKLSESNVEKLILRHIEFITQDIDEIKNRIATEKLPAGYVDLLKKKIADLEKQRVKLMFDPK